MPRVRFKAKDYARTDFERWIRAEMRDKHITNEAMGLMLGFSGQHFGRKLSKMSFAYPELVKILEVLDCPEDKMIYFMTGRLIREVN